MPNLTFAEQVKIVLGRKGMTIKELAELIEQQTGRKMSRQNLTQRLGRDNFQEKDMRMIAKILGCPFQLNILTLDEEEEKVPSTIYLRHKEDGPVLEKEEEQGLKEQERDITIGELLDIHAELEEMEKERSLSHKEQDKKEMVRTEEIVVPGRFLSLENGSNVNAAKNVSRIFKEYINKPNAVQSQQHATKEEKKEKPVVKTLSKRGVMPVRKSADADEVTGDINPKTGREYETNSVRVHPARIGYVQVYDGEKHQWIDMTEWAFMGYQERKKVLLGEKYEPPIYLE